jgi:fermentation-respiration switch protein FrsA (DUF1100 family)
MGRSLGSGVAVGLASERAVERLVLVTPFDRLASVARAHYPWLPVGLLLRERYDSVARAPAVKAPTLVVVAAEDGLVPRASSDALVAAFAPAQVRVLLLEQVDHNDIDLDPQYLESVAEFLAPGPGV